MVPRPTRRERCALGRHTPVAPQGSRADAVRHDTCRYCRQPIMRTQATRIWFAAGLMAAPATVAASAV